MELTNIKTEQRQPILIGTLNESPQKTIKGIPSDILNGITRANKFIDENYIFDVNIAEMIKEAGMTGKIKRSQKGGKK